MNKGQQHRQQGAALVTSLVLLTVLTLLSVSVMSTSRLQMTMAGNVMVSESAFQLAETAHEKYIATAINNPDCIDDQKAGFCNIAKEKVDALFGYRSLENEFVEYIAKCPPRKDGKNDSLGTLGSFHFAAVASGETTARGGVATHTQGWHVCR